MSEQNLPVLDKEGDEWILKVNGAGPVRIKVADRALASQIWEAATWAYRNGADDTRRQIKSALGIGP
jgi:hypothetical protein